MWTVCKLRRKKSFANTAPDRSLLAKDNHKRIINERRVNKLISAAIGIKLNGKSSVLDEMVCTDVTCSMDSQLLDTNA